MIARVIAPGALLAHAALGFALDVRVLPSYTRMIGDEGEQPWVFIRIFLTQLAIRR